MRDALNKLSRSRPELFTTDDIPGLIEAGAGIAIMNLGSARPELLTTGHLDKMVGDLKTDPFFDNVLDWLSDTDVTPWAVVSLFNGGHLSAIIDSMVNRIGSRQYRPVSDWEIDIVRNLARDRSELFTEDDVPKMRMIVRVNRRMESALSTLKEKKTDLFLP
jgi:hypothetical protein